MDGACNRQNGSHLKSLPSLIRADALKTLQSDVVRWVGEQNKKLRIETEL